MNTRRILRGLAAATVAAAAVLSTQAPAAADVNGWRWGLFEPICVRYFGTSKPAYLVDYAVKQWKAHPDIKMTFRSSCSGYKQKVLIREGKYGKDKSPAWIRYSGTSFPTPCASHCDDMPGYYWGPDQFGNWAWLQKSPVTIRINLSYSWTHKSFKAAVVHETGHAVDLSHTDKCDSVMSETCLGKSVPTEYDFAEIERLYPW